MTLQLTRIRDRRKALGLSQDQLAERAGTNQGQISRYENSESIPQADVLEAIARGLDCSADWLLGLSNNVNLYAATETELNAIEREAVNTIRASAPGKRQKIVSILKDIAEISI